ncbi:MULTISPECIES: Hsp20/alpha crystallin family protein [unclassified Psychrobacter]|uniref:Hsp20/alpha crystallin family protein n=1 Tax=unclassified Psychrobacter TaxID=196806 RepID=UPI00078C989D|nr:MULTISPECIES: Hsp20/alpha crystallin family protein [unclassified Psychrobacter]AMN50135.1 heat-shock protein Hsp20 [Psychrobacter sp. P2G3]AMN68008.1 heat-shock protein Hsp20 [Psychrobacter sp. P11G5]
MSKLITRNSIFDNFFDDMAPSFLMRPLHGDALPSANQIKIDVNEKDNKFYVNAEIPGVAKEDIDLSITGDIVSISAEIEQKDEQKEGNNVLRSERYFGSVSRSFRLPDKVKVDEAEASYENGVLQLVLPKETGSDRKKLEIK